MGRLLTPLVTAETYRGFAFVVSALPLGIVAAVLLFAGWGVTILLAITPLVVPLLIGLRVGVGILAGAEGAVARALVGAAVAPSWTSGGRGFWARAKAVLADGSFWREQLYLVLRVVVGWPLAILQLALVVSAGWAVSLPLTYRWQDDADVVGRHIDTLAEALVFVPAGVAVLLVAVHLVAPQRVLWSAVATRLLGGHAAPMTSRAATIALRRRILAILGAAVAAVSLLLVVVWALTGRSGIWPIFPIASLLLPLALVAWVFLVLERPEIERKTAGSRALAIQLGASAVVWVYLVILWACTGHGYFWPGWVLQGLGIAAGIHAGIAFSRRGRRRLHRIEELETTRAGAVDVQETELRRIERDLHDGAQARLVALGMSIGMAEEKLATDPEGARQLLAEARAGAREALEELRDLARGIYPPLLADKGLVAALESQARKSAVPVEIEADGVGRYAREAEAAVYFSCLEALQNVAKYASASRAVVALSNGGGVLRFTVTDDGVGFDQATSSPGTGLQGIADRLAALGGEVDVRSTPGAGTTVAGMLPVDEQPSASRPDERGWD
jgi:signal transduction histidine kinase